MGEVYEAIDHDGAGRVALKTLPHVEPRALQRFKREFRVLRELRHPGLVAMHDLVRDESGWFFTMERIDGVALRQYLRPGGRSLVRTMTGTAPDGEPCLRRSGIVELGAPVDEQRLADAIRQLCDALAHVHAHGLVHRDVKPSNVVVDQRGQLVLLDFGVISDQARRDGRAGTAAYMAPEQAAGAAVGTAADLYAVGLILLESLTGRVALSGERRAMLEARARAEPPIAELDTCAARSPRAARLAELAAALLAHRPEERPDARDVVRRLATTAPLAVRARWRAPVFVGREEELAALDQAGERARAGACAVAVLGEPGIGKTALVREFAARAARTGVLVLAGRSSERELVPFRAVDGMLDQLAEYLGALAPEERASLAPDDAAPLAAAFPVMAEVLGSPAASPAPPGEQRRRMFACFRRLLAALAERLQVVLVLDDAQWADEDGTALLAHALQTPAPPILLVLTARGGAPPPIAAAIGLPCETVALGPLPDDAARALVEQLADGAGPAAIAEAAGGHPLFIEELVLDGDGEHPRAIDQLLGRRVSALPADARRVLQLVTVGRQVPRAVLAAATDVELGPALTRLHALRLISSGERGSALTVEPYHARVRDVVSDMVDGDALREHHRALARAYEARGAAGPEELAAHWAGAGEFGAARGHAEAAARQAHAALAFDRAARWYRRARELAALAGAPSSDIARLDACLGDVLVDAGRGRDAAAALLLAAAEGDPSGLRRRAAEQLLLAGDIDAGLAVLRGELRAVGLAMPSRWLALPTLAMRRLQVAARGLEPRGPIRAEPDRLSRIDLSWTLAHGLAMVDTLAGADFQSRHLLLALESGEPYRLTRALALEASYLAALRGDEDRSRRALAGARRAADATGSAHARALVEVASCIAAFFRGRYREALAAGLDAEQRLLTMRGAFWELGIARHHALLALVYLGELRQVSERAAALIEDARVRGDRYGEVYLRTGVAPFLHLAADEPSACRDDAIAAGNEWAQPRWRVQIYATMMAVGQAALYTGDPAAALAAVDTRWPALARSLLLDIGLLRVESFRLRARAHLAAAHHATGRERRRHLRRARRYTRRVARERGIPGGPFAELLAAAIAHLGGDDQAALARLDAAERSFAAADMSLMACVSRRSRGLLLGGDHGAARVAAEDGWMRGQAIQSPERFARMLAPGFGPG
jgi:hypothetical protein